jgi:hypothetical protein
LCDNMPTCRHEWNAIERCRTSGLLSTTELRAANYPAACGFSFVSAGFEQTCVVVKQAVWLAIQSDTNRVRITFPAEDVPAFASALYDSWKLLILRSVS